MAPLEYYSALLDERVEEPAGFKTDFASVPRATDNLADVGHHGPNDVIISLDRGLKREAVTDESRVLLAAAGIGFTYAAALIQWGPA